MKILSRRKKVEVKILVYSTGRNKDLRQESDLVEMQELKFRRVDLPNLPSEEEDRLLGETVVFEPVM